MLEVLAISNYRSLRNLTVPLRQLNLITGPNGSGKSNIYRALRLLADTAQGRVIGSLALEGELQSTLWAGPESISRAMGAGETPVQGTKRRNPINLRMGFAGDEFGYLIDLGLPKPGSSSAFGLDPEIKRECIWHGPAPRPSGMLVDRYGPVVRVREDRTGWSIITDNLPSFDSLMTHVSNAQTAPEILALRESIRGWRFYDHFRTDAAAPARLSQIGTRTPILANDGSDLAAAIQTIREIGDSEALTSAGSDAFPGSRIWVNANSGRFTLKMEQHGLLRPLESAELSDGTLRYVLWIAALLTPRPPALMVLNEPETSMHPDLLPALARLIARTAHGSQVIVVTHSTKIIESLSEQPECHAIALGKTFGETTVCGMSELSTPVWNWPSR